MKKRPKVPIIIVNWNGKHYLKDCLTSISNQTYPNYEVILVDNGSTDGSVEFVKENYPNVRVIELEKNYGFARGSNIGMKEALKDKNVGYIALLNNDTKVDKNWLYELVKVAEIDEKIGMVQSKMLTMDNPKIINSTGHEFKFGKIVDRGCGEVDYGQYDDKLNIIGACAGACLYKIEMLESIGLFDESFFMYYEDAELSWRAFRHGWIGRFAPSSIVYHKVGGSTKKDKKMEQKMGGIAFRNIGVTSRRYGTFYQKLLLTKFLFYTGIKSGVGKWIGKNNWGSKPYIIGLIELWKPEKHELKIYCHNEGSA